MAKRKIIPYNKELNVLARKLRNNSTLSEVLLWNELKNRKLGYQFLRQRPMLNYIVDFYCPKLDLIIEIDGRSHEDPAVAKNDIIRQKELEAYSLTFLRFDDLLVKTNLRNVLDSIWLYIEDFEQS